MNPNHTITRRLALLLTLCAGAAFAHGGLEHVKGTITKISDAALTINTTDGKTVEVAVNAKTTYSRDGKVIRMLELKAGDRVVIHAEKTDGKLIAHTVEAGTQTAAKTAQH